MIAVFRSKQNGSRAQFNQWCLCNHFIHCRMKINGQVTTFGFDADIILRQKDEIQGNKQNAILSFDAAVLNSHYSKTSLLS